MEQNFNLYHIFYTVAKCRNISGAARELYISQPAISKAISKLEQSLGTTLFYRSSRGVSLTEPGEILFVQVENAFQAITQGEEQLQRFQKLGMGHLSIGVSATLCKYVLLPILQPFIRQNPHIQLSIACQSSLETMQALEQGTLDIGLIGAEDDMSAFVFEPLTDIQDIFVTTHTYLDNLKERIRPNDHLSSRTAFAASTLLLLNKENITRRYIDRYLSQESLSASRIIDVTSMDLLIEFAKIDLGIACVIKNFVRDELAEGRLVQLKMPVSIPARKIGFAYAKSGAIPPTVRELLSFLQELEVQKAIQDRSDR